MPHFVSIFDLEEGTVESLVGPFDSAKEAMDWADREAQERKAEDSNFEIETSDDTICVCSDDEDGPGYLLQVIEPTSPAVEAEPVEDE